MAGRADGRFAERGWEMISLPQISRAEVQQVLDQNPDLSANGWRYKGSRHDPEMLEERFQQFRFALTTPDGIAQIETACRYLHLHGPKTRNGSYGLKHDMERWGQSVGLAGYVSNGAAIVAAILCGHGIERERNSPNCVIVPA
jgi:hypothetical protein